MNDQQNDETLPPFTMEVTESVDENGMRTRCIVSTHSDGFVCLQILTEEDLRRREQYEAQAAALRNR